jgi:hypothetical protein
MNHYEKNAYVAVRVIGCCVTIYALFSIVYCLLAYAGRDAAIYTFSSIFYVVVGVVLFLSGRRLAAFIARGLKDD